MFEEVFSYCLREGPVGLWELESESGFLAFEVRTRSPAVWQLFLNAACKQVANELRHRSFADAVGNRDVHDLDARHIPDEDGRLVQRDAGIGLEPAPYVRETLFFGEGRDPRLPARFPRAHELS